MNTRPSVQCTQMDVRNVPSQHAGNTIEDGGREQHSQEEEGEFDLRIFHLGHEIAVKRTQRIIDKHHLVLCIVAFCVRRWSERS